MSGSVNKAHRMLLVAYALAIWTSDAQENNTSWAPVKFPSEDEEPSVPQIVVARLTPRNDDSIIFTHDRDHADKGDKHVTKHATSSSLQIPIDIIQCLNSIENIAELPNCINTDALPDDDGSGSEIGNRFGSDDGDAIDRKAAVIPKSATCTPELVTVPLQTEDDKSVFYYPPCTRVERCGGCCSHELLSCQPTATELITFQVIETRYEGGSKLNYKGKKYVTVEQHTKCKCNCKVKEEHCNQLQRYEKSECGCVCVNMDEEEKCIAENDTKLWDPKQCLCACRYIKECSTGFYFDQKTCNCSPVPIIRRRISDSNLETRHRWGEIPHFSYEVMPRPVKPLNKVTEKDDEEQ